MQICVDALPLLDRRGTGVFEYTRHLLDALFGFSEDKFILYANSYQYRLAVPAEWRGKKNIKVLETKMPNKIRNLSQAFLRRPRLNRLLQKNNFRPDLYYFPNLDFFVFDEKIPYILTAHDLSFEISPGWFSPKKRLWHKLINPRTKALGAEKIVAVSKNTKSDLVNIYGVPPEKIEVIYPGLNALSDGMSEEEMRFRHFLPENFVLYLGTVERRKNIAGLISAFGLIAKKFPEYFLVLGGAPGPGFGDIWALAKKSKFGGRIIFLDYIPEAERKTLYKMAKLFVYPSFYEGFGMPPLEAMSVGLPVVASAASSLGEVLGEAALTANPYNISEIAAAMEAGLSDTRLREELIAKGYRQIARFSWEKAAGELNNIFQKII